MDENDNQDRLSVIPWVLLLIIVVMGFFFYKSRQDTRLKAEEEQKKIALQKEQEKKTMEKKAKETISIELAEQNKSGQSGTAAINEEDGKVMVVVALTGGDFTQPQPAHFHEGTCDKPGRIVYPLKDLEKGRSETTLDTTLEKLNNETPLILNVHKSNDELKVYTSCGVLE